MSRNGSGTYTLPAGNPVVTGTTITSSWANTTMQNIADGLTQSVASDGQTPMSGALNMATNKITALGTPTVSTDAVTKAYADALIGAGSAGVFSSVTDSGLTTGRVTYATTAGLLTDSANMTFDGTTVTSSFSGAHNGTVGATTANTGSFTSLAYSTTLTGGTGIVNLGSGQFYKDASGNVGIGTATPSGFLANKLVIATGGTANEGMTIYSSSNNGSIWFAKATTGTGRYQGGIDYQHSTDKLYFYSATQGNMVLDGSGNLIIANAGSSATSNNNGIVNFAGGATNYSHISGTASGTTYIGFNYNASTIGSITQNGTTAVLYNTTSDYRLKSDVTPIQNALTTIEALNPVSFTWIDGRKDDGFIAHELQAVIPNCVTGEKDATRIEKYEISPAIPAEIDADGKTIKEAIEAVMGGREVPVYQQMDNSGVIPFLVKAIQELKAEVDALKAVK